MGVIKRHVCVLSGCQALYVNGHNFVNISIFQLRKLSLELPVVTQLLFNNCKVCALTL